MPNKKAKHRKQERKRKNAWLIKFGRTAKHLINEGLIQEECDICKWNESRITDNKICLHLDYIDGDIKNKEYDNLRLVCSNCYFTNVGNFKNAKIFCQ